MGSGPNRPLGKPWGGRDIKPTRKCHVASGFGFIFGSSKELMCIYSPDNGKDSQRYTGKIQKFKIREMMSAELGLSEQETA